MRKLLLAVLLTFGLSVALAAPASASGAVNRTFSAYDLTNGTYMYDGTPAEWAYVRTAPLVSKSSYYDATFADSIPAYQRMAPFGTYQLAGFEDGKQIKTTAGAVAHVICYDWSNHGTGDQFDLVQFFTYVNSTTGRWYIAWVPDYSIREYVIDGQHGCWQLPISV